MNDRIDRLRAKLEEPLLVSDAANIRYLSGFVSSNAALFVEPDRVRLFTDFRYAESARAVEGAEFVEAKRDLYQTLSEHSPAASASRAPRSRTSATRGCTQEESTPLRATASSKSCA